MIIGISIVVAVIWMLLICFAMLAPLFFYFSGIRVNFKQRKLYYVPPKFIDNFQYYKGQKKTFRSRKALEKELRYIYLLLAVTAIFFSILWMADFAQTLEIRG